MVTIEEAIRISKQEGRCNIDLTGVLSDAALFKQACHDMYEMFEREVFDIVISTEISGGIFASVVADRTNRGMAVVAASANTSQSDLSCEYQGHHGTVRLKLNGSAVRSGMKAVIVCDVLRSGKDLRAVIDMLGDKGVSVIKIGCFVEDSSYEARKTLLRGIPLESRVFTDDF